MWEARVCGYNMLVRMCVCVCVTASLCACDVCVVEEYIHVMCVAGVRGACMYM